jgi:hypothetical protein
VPIRVVVPTYIVVMMRTPHADSNSTVMAAAMIADADADSSGPNDDSRSIRSRNGHWQRQSENRKRSE